MSDRASQPSSTSLDDENVSEEEDVEHGEHSTKASKMEDEGLKVEAYQNGGDVDVGNRRQQKKQQSAHGPRPSPSSMNRPSLTRKRYNSSFYLVMAIVVLIVYTAGPVYRPSPVPKWSVIKPLDPNPAEAFLDLMQRYAEASRAIIESGIADEGLYDDLLRDANHYYHELTDMLAHDWSLLEYSSTRRHEADWQQLQERTAGRAKGWPPPPARKTRHTDVLRPCILPRR